MRIPALIFLFFYIGISKAGVNNASIIVQLNPHAQADQVFVTPSNKRGNLMPFIEVSSLKRLSASMNIWEISLKENQSYEACASMLKADKRILSFEKTMPVYRRDVTLNDQFFTAQWNLHNTGQGGGKVGADIKYLEAWDNNTSIVNSQGDTLVIAVIDEPIDSSISQINWFINRQEIPDNSIDDDANGYVDDYRGWNTFDDNGIVYDFKGAAHGSHVCGIIGAKSNDNIGTAGVHSGVKILPIVGGDVMNTANIVQAYNYIIEMKKLYFQSNKTKGAFIVATNSSFGIDAEFAVDHPIWCAMYDSLGKYGILSAASTTNALANIDAIGDMPTTCLSEFLITVSSTNFQDINKAGFGSSSIDLHAPGEGIYSTKPGGIYGTLNGTSMASPHVAGAISYLYSKACDSITLDYYSDMAKTSRYFKNAIMEGVDTIPILVNKSVTGGRLNMYKSLEKIKKCKPKSSVSTINNPIEIKVAQDAFSIRFYNGSESLHVQIFNAIGKKFYDETHMGDFVILTDKFPNQIYFMRIHDKNGNIFTHKFYPHQL